MVENSFTGTGRLYKTINIEKDENGVFKRAWFSMFIPNSHKKDAQDTLVNCVLFRESTVNYLEKYLKENGRFTIEGRLTSSKKDEVLTNSIIVNDVLICDFVDKEVSAPEEEPSE